MDYGWDGRKMGNRHGIGSVTGHFWFAVAVQLW